MKKALKLLAALILSVCILNTGFPGTLPPAARAEMPAGVMNVTMTNAAIDSILIQNMSLDQSAETARFPATPIDPARYNIGSNMTMTNHWKILLSGYSSAESGSYPANQTLAGMGKAVSSLPLAENEAVMSLTVDNFWIAGRSPATEEELKKQPKVILGKNRGTQLYVNGQEATVSTDLEKAKALIVKAEASVKSAEGILEELKNLKELKNPESIQSLTDTIAQANTFISQAKAATDEQLLAYVTNQGYDYLNGLAGMPSSLAYSFLIQEQGGLDAGSLSETLGISENDLTTFAARSGFTLENLIAFFTEKRMTLQDFSTMLTGITDMGYTIKDFIEAGVLDNEGVGGLVVRLEDSAEGIQAVFTAPSGVTYHFCGAVILNNGMQIQLGDPLNKEDTSQKFGEVKMDTQGTTCFFSTVYSEALGLFPGEMLISRYMVIQDADRNPILYWFDETGSRTELGPLKDLDPDGTIAKIFSAAGYENGLPLKADGNSFPEDFDYLSHDFEYTVQQAPTCLRMGIERIKCKNCGFELAKNLPMGRHQLTKTEKKEATCTETGTEAYWTCAFCHRLFEDAAGLLAIGQPAVIPVNPDNHDLTDHAAQAPTCTAVGWEAYQTCSRCGYTTYAEKPALGHNLVDGAAKAATCTEDGWDAYRYCTRKGCDYTTKVTVRRVHKFDTALTAGETTHWYACVYDGCTGKKDEAAHVWSNWTPVTSTGNHQRTCAACGAVQTEAHTGGTATCVAQAVCSVCGEAYGETDPDNHDLTDHAAQAPTCTAVGWKVYQTCSRCDYTTYAEKPALGHDLTDHTAQAPTCTAVGWEAYQTCSRCDYTTYAEKPALGHTLTDGEAKAATCTEDGWAAYQYCTREGCEYTTKELIPAGHTLVKTEAVEPSTGGAGNSEYWTCSRCGKFFGDAEGKTEISEGSWIRRLQPSIQAPGLSIPPQDGMTVGEVVELLFTDATLVYDGAPVDRSDTMSYTCTIDAGRSSADAAGSSFQVAVSIAPENTEIYETATGTFTVSIEPLELTPGS